MILIVDHHDSFTINLAQAFQSLRQEVRVVVHDTCSFDQLLALQPTAVVLGPGPGHPRDALLAHALLAHSPLHLPILGVCLGHQVMGEHGGAVVQRSIAPMHGMSASVHHQGTGLFQGIPSPAEFIRYNSLTVLPHGLSPVWIHCAWSVDGEIMGMQHREAPWYGVQFHPESAWSPHGMTLLSNFLTYLHRGSGGR